MFMPPKKLETSRQSELSWSSETEDLVEKPSSMVILGLISGLCRNYIKIRTPPFPLSCQE